MQEESSGNEAMYTGRVLTDGSGDADNGDEEEIEDEIEDEDSDDSESPPSEPRASESGQTQATERDDEDTV